MKIGKIFNELLLTETLKVREPNLYLKVIQKKLLIDILMILKKLEIKNTKKRRKKNFQV